MEVNKHIGHTALSCVRCIWKRLSEWDMEAKRDFWDPRAGRLQGKREGKINVAKNTLVLPNFFPRQVSLEQFTPPVRTRISTRGPGTVLVNMIAALYWIVWCKRLHGIALLTHMQTDGQERGKFWHEQLQYHYKTAYLYAAVPWRSLWSCGKGTWLKCRPGQRSQFWNYFLRFLEGKIFNLFWPRFPQL